MKLSFEFFPPKSEDLELSLWQSISDLEVLKPDFFSVTYGAGGSTRDRTFKILSEIAKRTNIPAACHLTCIASTKAELQEIAENLWQGGVKHILALRGDLPEGYIHPKDGYNYAYELVAALRQIHDFEISVAGYPEKHPEALSLAQDIENLQKKISAGASRVITQFFFDNNKFVEYLNLLQARNIKTPIVPGILPITAFNQVKNFAAKCDATIPEFLQNKFTKCKNPEDEYKIARDFAIEQCLFLKELGVSEFHFYTLNKAKLTKEIVENIL